MRERIFHGLENIKLPIDDKIWNAVKDQLSLPKGSSPRVLLVGSDPNARMINLILGDYPEAVIRVFDPREDIVYKTLQKSNRPGHVMVTKGMFPQDRGKDWRPGSFDFGITKHFIHLLDISSQKELINTATKALKPHGSFYASIPPARILWQVNYGLNENIKISTIPIGPISGTLFRYQR
jgi:hypothetical protein